MGRKTRNPVAIIDMIEAEENLFEARIAYERNLFDPQARSAYANAMYASQKACAARHAH